MQFKNTYRFNPVIYENDMPWEFDPFHLGHEEVPETEVQRKKFFDEHDLEPDAEWWYKQNERCLKGYSVKNAIEPGGDYFVDEQDAFWNDSKKYSRFLKEFDNYEIPPNSVYLPEYDKLLRNNILTITNRHYFYLNFWNIYALVKDKDGNLLKPEKDLTSPRFTDIDLGFFWRIELAHKKNLDQSEAKSRQKGYSSKIGGGVIGFNYTFVGNSQNIIAGGMSDDADKTFRDFKNGIQMLTNTQFHKIRSKSQDDFYKALYSGAEVHSISCKDNSQAISRFTPYCVVYEEIGKWKKGLIKDAVEFVNVSLRAEGHKSGWSIFIGTGGNMDLGAADLENMHYNPNKNNLLAFRNKWEEEEMPVNAVSGHFTPDWSYRIIDKDGNSLKEASLIQWEKDYEKKDADKRIIFRSQQARYAADAFLSKGGGYFDEVVINGLNTIKSTIRKHPELQTTKIGKLEWEYKKDSKGKKQVIGIHFIADEDGEFVINEHPKIDPSTGRPFSGLYKSGIDSYDQDEAQTSTSKLAVRVFKTKLRGDDIANTFVAGILIRPDTIEGGSAKAYEAAAKLCYYYNSVALIEYSKIRIFDWFTKHGFEGYLKLRPDYVIAGWVDNPRTSNRYGIDGSTKHNWLAELNDYLRDNWEKMRDVDQITNFIRFKLDKNYNCDDTIASALCIVHWIDDNMEEIDNRTRKKEEIDNSWNHGFKIKNGNIVQIN